MTPKFVFMAWNQWTLLCEPEDVRADCLPTDQPDQLKSHPMVDASALNNYDFSTLGVSVLLQRSLLAALWAAALLAGVRGGAVWVGSALGARLGRAEPDVGRRLWQGMITQVRRCSTFVFGVVCHAVEHAAAVVGLMFIRRRLS